MASDEEKSRSLITGLSAMLHSLSLNIVAEGIENAEVVQFCQQLNIQRAQGYYYAKPLPVDDIEKNYF